MDHASDVYIGGGFWFICLGNFCLFVLGGFGGVCLFYGSLFSFFVLFQRSLITSVSLENKDVPGTWFNDLLVKYICSYCTDK